MTTQMNHSFCGELLITCNNIYHLLLVNGHIIPLTRTEYRLCTAFLQPWLAKNKEPLMNNHGLYILSYATAKELQVQTSIASKQLLRKHISNTNGKLAPFALRIKAFEQGYILLRATTQS